MGMYDSVNAPPKPCHKCGNELNEWQSKDGPCVLDLIELNEVDVYYNYCWKCRTMNTYVRNEDGEFELFKRENK